MLVSFSSSDASQQPSVLAGRCDLRELVEGEHFSAGLDDSSSGGRGESESADSELRDLGESFVVEYGADDNEDLLSLLFGVGVLDESGDRDREPVVQALVESLENDFVELRVGSSGQELVELGYRRLL